MWKREDVTGKIFAMAGVTAIEFHSQNKDGHAVWLFECNCCGGKAIARVAHIKRGQGISCRCKSPATRKKNVRQRKKCEKNGRNETD